jgi:hypothetical protein
LANSKLQQLRHHSHQQAKNLNQQQQQQVQLLGLPQCLLSQLAASSVCGSSA